MSDEFERLRGELRAATPRPDPAKKAEDIARAMEIFDRAQGSGAQARPMSDRRRFGGRIGQGVAKMIHALSSRGAIAATTALVAVGVTFYVGLPELRNAGLRMPEAVLGLDEAGEAQLSVERRRADTSTDDRDGLEVDALTPETAPVRKEEAADLADAAVPAVEAELLGTLQLPTAPEPSADFAFSGEAQVGIAPQVMAERQAAPAGGLYAPADVVAPAIPDTEAFANEDPNPLKVTAEAPVSTFSIDVDTASWGVVRSSLNRGQLPPREAVRIEEMVNYFPYAYPAPEADGAPFRPTVTVTETPWNPGTEIVHIALQGRMPALDERPPLNLVFLVDSSGSMDDPAKLPLLKQSFRLMLGRAAARGPGGHRHLCRRCRAGAGADACGRARQRYLPRSTGFRLAARPPGRRGSIRPTRSRARWPTTARSPG